VRGTVRVINTGNTVWLAGAGTGHVRLGVQLLAPDGAVMERDFARYDLGGDVAEGVSLDVEMALTLPDGDRAFGLKLDLVDEDICWFEDVGSPALRVSV
ncbi:MAG TPA: hypothetical protein VGQ33_13500, partial [Vicinamibacteria bacterium]|nr:hypothetical protein [Vicinamibacteria bacterium]